MKPIFAVSVFSLALAGCNVATENDGRGEVTLAFDTSASNTTRSFERTAKRARFQAKKLNVSWRATRPERRALWFANQSGFVANENLLMCIDRGGCKRGRLRHQCAVNECAKRAVPVRRRITRKFFSQKFCQALSRCP